MASKRNLIMVLVLCPILVLFTCWLTNPTATFSKEYSYGPVPSCSSQTIGDVSREVWTCFKSATKLQMGFNFPLEDRGRVSHRGATISYNFDANARVVNVTVEDKPFFTSCSEINNRISEHFTDCHGPTVTGPNRIGNADQWKIDGPNVRRPLTAYPQVQLRPGDRVRIDADGCVQTGGGGQTWKLYVDPRGAKSSNLFHGTIKLPGMTAPQTLREFVSAGNNYQIRTDFAGDMKLYLGYQDEPDQYANNGYWGHDNGDPVQCKGVGKAWVLITVYHPKEPLSFRSPTKNKPEIFRRAL